MSVQVPVVSKLGNWDKKASVRVKPRRVLQGDEMATGKFYFTPELVPVSLHSLVQALGPAAVQEVQVQHLYRYLDFTARLEQEVVNAVAMKIALEKTSLELPEVMVEDAFKLYTDEAHHAFFSDDIKRQVRAATGIVPDRSGTPLFLKHLRALQTTVPADLIPLSEMLFTVVSETLISSILSDIPKDERVVTAVREMVADHAEDEGRHSAYFSQFFSYLWPQLTLRQKATLGPLLPQFIVAFLEPDCLAIRRGLAKFPLKRDQMQAVVDETYPAARVAAGAREAAHVTVHLFQRSGVMEDPQCADEFQAWGLID